MEFKVSVDPSIIEMADAIKRLGDLVPPSQFEEKQKTMDEISAVFLKMVKS